MVGQARKIAHPTCFYELFSRPMRICSSKEWKNHGVLGVHTADRIGDGNETFHRVMTALRKEFDFGTWDIGNFRFEGRQFSQMPNGDIVFDMEQFKLNKLKCPRLKRPRPERNLNTKEAYTIPRRCWKSRLAHGSLLSTVIIATGWIAPKNNHHRQCKIYCVSTRWSEALWVFMMHLMQTLKLERHNKAIFILAVHDSITDCRVPVSVLSWQSKKEQEGCPQQFGFRGKQYVDLSGTSWLDAHDVGTNDPQWICTRQLLAILEGAAQHSYHRLQEPLRSNSQWSCGSSV